MTVQELRNATAQYINTFPVAEGQGMTEAQILEIANGTAHTVKSPRDAASGLATGRTIVITKQVVRDVVTEVLNSAMAANPGVLSEAELVNIANSTEMAITEKGVPASKPKTK